MEKFTNGEWVVESELLDVTVGNGIRTVCDTGHRTNKENISNAHLIAAAPEMYAMLNSFLCLEGIVKTGPIIELLAKARGESCGK